MLPGGATATATTVVAIALATIGLATGGSAGSTGRARCRYTRTRSGALAGTSNVRGHQGGRRQGWLSSDLHLLQQKVCTCLCKSRVRAMHLEDRHHMAEFTAQAAKERENHLPIANGITELGKGGSHGFKAMAVVGNGQGVLAEVAKLGLEKKSTRLPLSEKLIFKELPGLTSSTFLQHEGLLQVARDGAVYPGENNAVRLRPSRTCGERLVLKNVLG